MPPPIDSPDQIMSILNGGSEQRRVRYRQQPDGTLLADTGADGRPGQTTTGWGQPGTSFEQQADGSMKNTGPTPNLGAPGQTPGQPLLGRGGFNLNGSYQRPPMLDNNQLFAMISRHDTADSNPLSPYYTGARQSVMDPGSAANVLNFMAAQQHNAATDQSNMLDRANQFGELGIKQQQVDINRGLAGERTDPRAARVQHALELAKRGLTPAQTIAELGKFDQAMQAVGPGSEPSPSAPAVGNPAGQPPANAGGKPGVAPNAVSVEQERMRKLGPEPYGWLNQQAEGDNKQNIANQALVNLFRHDQANPGYMQTHGADVMALLNQNYGDSALGNFMNPGAVSTIGTGLSSLFGSTDASDTEKARSAFRHYMGYTKPMPWWVNAARGINPDLAQLGDEHPGVPPIPGSPGAKRVR